MTAGLLGTIFQWLGYAQYNATPPVAASGSNVPLQSDVNGNLLVNIGAATAAGAPVPSGTALTGATNAIPTGNSGNWVDLSADVTVQLAAGASDGETKVFGTMTSTTAIGGKLIVQMADGTKRLYSAENLASGQFKPQSQVNYPGVANLITLTWSAKMSGNAGGWVCP